MSMELEWGKIIAAFISIALKPLVGVPFALGFGFSIWETLLIGSLGGILGTVLFTFVTEALLKLYMRLLNTLFPNRIKRNFTWFNRFVVRIKKTFGLIGIAFIAPPLMSIPVGVFLGVRFFGDRLKVITWMSLSVVAWIPVLYYFAVPVKNLILHLFD